jgi:hypothetical protein
MLEMGIALVANGEILPIGVVFDSPDKLDFMLAELGKARERVWGKK